MAGVVLTWVDATRADDPKQRSVLQQELEKHRRQEDVCTYLTKYYWSSGAYIHTWALRKPSVCCSNHVVGGSSDDKSRGPSLFADGSAGREYADAIWRREESISPSSAGDHTTKESLHGFTTSGPAVFSRMTRADSSLVVEWN